jgi:hypothetical protein
VDFGGLLVLGVMWLLFNLIGQGKKRAGSGSRESRPRPGFQPRPGGAGGSDDPTQQEGSRLEQLLRELERNLESAAGAPPTSPPRLPSPRPIARPLPPGPVSSEEEDVEERESLEVPERVVSLEQEVRRPQRAAYDQDTEAEAIARRRIEAARRRDGPLRKADHKAFDAKIRQEPADHTAVRRYTPAQLRDAIVWREILGPPVSEREP